MIGATFPMHFENLSSYYFVLISVSGVLETCFIGNSFSMMMHTNPSFTMLLVSKSLQIVRTLQAMQTSSGRCKNTHVLAAFGGRSHRILAQTLFAFCGAFKISVLTALGTVLCKKVVAFFSSNLPGRELPPGHVRIARTTRCSPCGPASGRARRTGR